MSPAETVCFDIFSPPPGDSDVISQVDRLSSNETKIAPRSVRIAVGAWGRSVIICMVASRVGGSATSLCQSVGRYPLPMGSLFSSTLQVLTHLRHVERPGAKLLQLQKSFTSRVD